MGGIGLAAADETRPMQPVAAPPVIDAFDPQKVSAQALAYIYAAT